MRKFIRGFLCVVNYGFGDASGTDFGSSWITWNDTLKFRYEVCGSDKEDESSNFKELNNLVDTLKEMTRDKDGIQDVELFLLTENSVAEGA